MAANGSKPVRLALKILSKSWELAALEQSGSQTYTPLYKLSLSPHFLYPIHPHFSAQVTAVWPITATVLPTYTMSQCESSTSMNLYWPISMHPFKQWNPSRNCTFGPEWNITPHHCSKGNLKSQTIVSRTQPMPLRSRLGFGEVRTSIFCSILGMDRLCWFHRSWMSGLFRVPLWSMFIFLVSIRL